MQWSSLFCSLRGLRSAMLEAFFSPLFTAVFIAVAAFVLPAAAVFAAAGAAAGAAGDYEGLGPKRAAELSAAAAAFDLKPDNVVCLNEREMQDGWAEWPPELVTEKIHEFLLEHKHIQLVRLLTHINTIILSIVYVLYSCYILL